ncbi:NAD(P)-dependent oxidoreductase [Solimonas fluminis]|uniref:NAD(P)-dependent oxidoreductase n=1 Tax=Solimonas fluminis TaxID=2086571 RepID=A0A2S5THD1_9GAMM|nr:SDR family oxidoreductase [Solimonas fluminis]PPE74393.1 NAD(P)-dependent oxidoreductase [Solimonas fluminis]
MTGTQARRDPVVVVTGASQGIGAAIAERFASGLPAARLALVARNGQRLEQVARECRRSGAQAEIFPADLTDPGRVEQMALEVQQRFGAVDVLINNAGRWRGGAVQDLPVSEFSLALQENLVSAFAVTRAFVPAMIERRQGDIFFTSSTSGLEGLANNAAYCAAKHGVTGLARALRAELSDRGIRVCCVYPGATDTPTWEGSDADVSRFMSAADVAQVFFDAYQLSRRSMVEDIILRPPKSA